MDAADPRDDPGSDDSRPSDSNASDAGPSGSPPDLDERLERFLDRDWDDGLDGRTEADPPLRVAMVGLGEWTRERALPAVADADYAETTALVSGSREKAERVADAAGVPHALDYEGFHAGGASGAYDAAYVATPNATHLEHVAAAAGLGKAVLCEKPLEATVERAERLVAACEDAGVPLMVAYRMQTEPTVRLARALVREGWVGEPVQAHGADSFALLDANPDPDQWRLDADRSGGCALADLGVYPLNTLRFVLDADPVRAGGTTRSEHAAFADVDEHVSFTCEFPGVTAVCTASHGAYGSGHLRVLGTEGRLTLDRAFHPWDPRTLTLDRAAGRERVTVRPGDVDQMREEFDYFATRVLTGREPHPDGRHALVDVRAVAAVYESAADGALVPLDR
jgi:xylose dehydrogenase (NAD/NADP)